jgi:hypothetical protein
MTGYEQSPDYGDPESGWRADVLLALTIIVVIGAVIYRLMH